LRRPTWFGPGGGLVWFSKMAELEFFIYFLYFATINDPLERLYIGRHSIAVRHGGRGRGPLARAHTDVGHGVRGLPPCGTTVEAYRQAAAWPPGSVVGHSGMYRPTTAPYDKRIFCKFQF
jgi:hypothetical protein